MQSQYYYQLQTCVWEITLSCCFSCRYCGSKAGTAREKELSTEECLDVAGQLAELGCRRVSLIGGEVFMRRDWNVIADALTKRQIKVSIITNGYLFSDEILSAIKETNIESVAISLDGTENVHDEFRQIGSFKRAMRAIDVLSENDIPVSVISTLHSKNAGCLEDVYKILKEKKIFAWQLQACSPMGNAKGSDFSTEIDFGKVIHFVEKHVNNPYFAIGIADNIGYYAEREDRLRGNTRGIAPFLGCRAGLTNIGIDSVGNVRGCESMYDPLFIEGNLRDKSLREIWESPDAFAYNRKFTSKRLSGTCKNCIHACQCAGGCRSYNFFTNGNLYESSCCVSRNEELKVVE